MSYQLLIQPEKPYTVNSLDLVSSPDRRPSLVYGSGYSALLTGTNTVTSSFPGFVQSRRDKAFALECWLRPVRTVDEFIVLGHSEGDGVIWNGEIIFRLKLTTGDIELTYSPTRVETFHVVGQYNAGSMALYVNGTLVAHRQLSDAEEDASLISFANQDELVSGSGSSEVLVDSLAMYAVPLSGAAVQNHYQIGSRKNPIMETVLTMGGATAELSRHSVEHNVYQYWSVGNWPGAGDNVSTSSVLAATVPGGAWKSSLEIPEAVNNVVVQWEGAGNFTVETNVDNAGWVSSENGTSVATGAVDSVEVRVTFSDTSSYLTKLTLQATSETEVPFSGSARTVTFSGGLAGGRFYPLDNLEVVGAEPPITINPDSEDVTSNVYTVEAWIKPEAADLVTDWIAEPGTAYVNGNASSTLYADEWNHVVVALTTPTNLSITVNGSGRIGMVNVYSSELDASKVERLFNSYFGPDTFSVDPSPTTMTISPSEYDFYAYEWSIIGAG